MNDILIAAPSAKIRRLDASMQAEPIDRIVRVYRNAPDALELQIRAPEGAGHDGRRNMIANVSLDRETAHQVIEALEFALRDLERQQARAGR